jgi:hypothetical protein
VSPERLRSEPELLRLAASEDFAAQSTKLASAGADQLAEGLAALALAQGARDAVQALVQEGVDQIARGAQAIGASEMLDATAKTLVEEHR